MGLLDDYSGPGGIQGIGMTPRPTDRHQECIALFIIGLAAFRKKYKVLPESAIDLSNLNSKAPDIVVYDKSNNKAVLFIEITTTSDKKKILKKSVELMKEYKVSESFVYDYEEDNWEKNTGNIMHNLKDSFSDIIKYDLKKCLVEL